MRGRKLGLGLAVLEAALAAALAVTVVGCAASSGTKTSTSGGSAADPIKIGAIVSLTGTYAGLGVPEKNTLEMEAKRINDAGGINGRKIEVIVEDDGTDEAKAVAAASKLIEQDNVVAIIGGTGTGQSMAIRGDIDRANIPQVSMAGGSAITASFDPLVFQTPWPNRIVLPFTFADMKKQGVTKIGVISDTGGFGKDGLAVAKTEAPKAGIAIVADQPFNVGDTGMTTQLTKIKGTDAQAILVISSGKEAATVVQNAKQLGIKLPLWGTHGNARLEFIQGAGDAAEGFRFAAGKILIPESWGKDSESYKVAQDFISRYSAAYNGEKPTTFAGHAYDALNIIAEAAKRVSGDLTPVALRDEIEKTSGFVGIGGVFTFSPTDHNGLSEKDLNMYVIKNGAWTLAP